VSWAKITRPAKESVDDQTILRLMMVQEFAESILHIHLKSGVRESFSLILIISHFIRSTARFVRFPMLSVVLITVSKLEQAFFRRFLFLRAMN
jgi:hypothetical protein